MKLKDIMNDITFSETVLPDINIEKVTAKLPLIENNTLFVLFQGINFDTRKIINDVQRKKPIAIVTDLEIDVNYTIPVIHVENARLAYSRIMWNFCNIDKRKTSFYAVTGTNGKTTTATMIFNIFNTSGIKCGFIGTGKILIGNKEISDLLYSMTTPDPEFLYPIIKTMQDEGCEKIVMEVSSHSLALYKVAPIRFDCSVFTNLSEEHLDFHKDIENYYKTKLILFQQSNRAIFNFDDKYSRRAFNETNDVLEGHSIGIINDADAMARDIILDGFSGAVFIYREKTHIFKVKLNLAGEYNISNALMAIKCAIISNICAKNIKESFEKLKFIDGRLEIISEKPMVIIDYAHTVKAIERLLKFVKSTKNTRQKIISVFGCGGDRDATKRPKMASAAEAYSDFVIVTSDNSRSESTVKIIQEIESGFKNKSIYKTIADRRDAIQYAISISDDDDIVLIIGKGHERYNIDSEGYHAFDERTIVINAISERLKKNENKNRY